MDIVIQSLLLKVLCQHGIGWGGGGGDVVGPTKSMYLTAELRIFLQ